VRNNISGSAILVVCVFAFSFAAITSYSRALDTALILLRLGLLVVLSVLVVCEWWQGQHGSGTSGSGAVQPRRETLLQRFRRWCYDEPKPGTKA